MEPLPPHTVSLLAAAEDLEQCHQACDRPPKEIPALANLQSLSHWLQHLRTRCLSAEPEATKAAEWLLDNHYQVERAIRQIRGDMPRSFYRRLPSLDDADYAGLPRIFYMATGFLDASHLQLSLNAASEFANAYQQSTPLTIAELWAFPTMLRLACLEILVSAASTIFPDLPLPFRPSAAVAALEVIDPTERIARALSSLQIISSIPWKDFFDRTSHVEKTLRRDPAKIYPRMDFETRDWCRKSVEAMAKGAGVSELKMAERVVTQAEAQNSGNRRNHVSYWLIDEGRDEIEQLTGYRAQPSVAAHRWVMRRAGIIYMTALIFLGTAAVMPPVLYLISLDAGVLLIFLGALLTLMPASILSITIVNWLSTLMTVPRILPKLDFEKAIPPDCQTAVVMPVIVGSVEEARLLLDRLAMHQLTNPDPLLRFVLLSDHKDAPIERAADDESVEKALVDGVQRLNEAYDGGGAAPFHLLHRPRQYNPGENCWMAWERKRGKLAQFNRFILTGEKAAFTLEEGETDALNKTRFVITLDADSVLPMGTANRLVGAMAHPLNQALIDPSCGCVVSGYTIIQPRIEISPECGPPSPFLRFYTGDTAIDIYSRAVSDIYQDLFGSAVFIGKGIYDVAAFEQTLADRIPENTLLSHDLFEGAHGRTALASDIVVYDGFPGAYWEYIWRWRRWVRGDWQLLPWLTPNAPGADNVRLPNRLTVLDRWKMVDNLRRSLIPIALVALAVAGWFVLPGNAWLWTCLTILTPAAYLFTDFISGISRARRRSGVQSTFRQFASHSGRWGLAVAFLLYEAVVSFDAIARTLWRLIVSRRQLLEWTSAAHTVVKFAGGRSHWNVWREMWSAPTIAAAITIILVFINPAALPPAAPLLVLWFCSPEIALWISRPYAPKQERLNMGERAFLRQIARRTWCFFETFVGPEDNWLPPDNFQEEPHAKIGHRTSPTNIGMLFSSSLTAWDFGYLNSLDFALRIENGLNALDKLERYRGHFLNWYDTKLLTPLEPRYVSTVDSGNLAVCLVTLRKGSVEAADAPAFRAAQWDGLQDTFESLADAVEAILKPCHDTALSSRMTIIKVKITAARKQPDSWSDVITELVGDIWPDFEQQIADAIGSPVALSLEHLHALNIWVERMGHDLSRMQWGFENLLPWSGILESPPPDCLELAGSIKKKLPLSMTLGEAAENCAAAATLVRGHATNLKIDEKSAEWCSSLVAMIERGAENQLDIRNRLLKNAVRAGEFANQMDFTLLYDQEMRLFNIGYNVSSDRMDTHHYDLLATEARLTSYFAIAKGDVPPEHWRFLGRPVTRMDGQLSLLSWNGSMFEYLMPPLWLCSGDGTLLNQAERTAITVQRNYAETLNIPWGVSESGFAARDAAQNYQYQAFGVPGLGIRRGLSQDMVVAPYASALALSTYPLSAVKNLRKLADLGLLKPYGFVEAADFTPERSVGRTFSPVQAFMAHHQGMVLAAIGNVIFDDILAKRFSSDMQMRTAELLLQERTPWELPPEPAREDIPIQTAQDRRAAPLPASWAPRSGGATRQIHLLGNGRFATWITQNGGGALWWHRHSLTRWRSDSTRDNHGLWIYVRDTDSNAVWSVTDQPTGIKSEDAHETFHHHMAEFHRRDHGIAIRTEIAVGASDDIEIRLVTVTNESDRARTLEFTSCGEIALAPPLDDERHPAFSSLFVGSEYITNLHALMFTRRAHHSGEHNPALLHRIIFDELGSTANNYEADRGAFFGRGGTIRQPHGVLEGLSNSAGWTLDPIMALQTRLVLPPQGHRKIAFVTLVAGSPESALEIAERYSTHSSLDWALNDANWDIAHEAQQLDIKPALLPRLQALASLIANPQPALRADLAQRKSNTIGQPRLWSLGISGDAPILLVRIYDPQKTDFLKTLISAHELWRRRLFPVDLVILRMGVSGYVEPVREHVLSLMRKAGANDGLGRNGGIHLILADQLIDENRRLLETAACVILDDSQGDLSHQLATADEVHRQPPQFEAMASPTSPPETSLSPPARLEFNNEFGGFSKDGKEYVIYLRPGESTPAPWSNILTNDQFGCLVTEAGGGFTWAINSGENRLTPWTNDPVFDPPSEALYLRDEETGEIWTPTPSPAGADAASQIHHGCGYTRWRKHSHGVEQDLTIFVAPDAPVKIARLRLKDISGRPRRLTATYYVEWLLGAMRSVHRQHVVCEYDTISKSLLARNSWNPEFSERVAFLASSRQPHSLTTDRRDFLGAEGSLSRPAGLLRWDLGGRVNELSDPCAAFQVHLDIAANETTEVIFILGQGANRADAMELIEEWSQPVKVDAAFNQTCGGWDKKLSVIEVKTPDPAFDLMVNRWLLYQTDSSRIMARAGFYQAGGAIGFRDQLQDVLVFLHTDPSRVRAHILECAARQFEEGDVLHWWHPPAGRGVRTRCSDDLLWLPYVTSRYVKATGDTSVLHETAPFLQAPPLSPEEEDRYALFGHSAEEFSLFDHCTHALERGVTKGAQGLPLMGAGDWNDGMNRVGVHGRGESVWLAWFSIATIQGYVDLATRMKQPDLAENWRKRANELRSAVDSAAWDGEWYVRAFDDDGHPWGSKTNEECQIDSIAQSWAVLSGGGQSERAQTAVHSAVNKLVSNDERLVRLFWPPIHETPRDPGYIKAYPPGIRENGGQYTHAAAWLGFALAELGDGDGAWRIFDLINPIRRTAARTDAMLYRDEPYVLAADVAGAPPHIGRGGWSWYTGAAAWTYRLGVEGILGLRLHNGMLTIQPCLPKNWGSAEVIIRKPEGTFFIRIEDPEHLGTGAVDITLDDKPLEGLNIAFPTDGTEHRVCVRIKCSQSMKQNEATSTL